ncbi:TPA: bifunctional folylpolyglutamate synthase/dihydrofolate synthase [Candidatus Woesearchaeota archaeon]|nr:bifunctional folylpolyglutamate synthase/dihydrofolate synthase [Candidatus Woesearchaeota archaeon]HIH47673.1 bifunctional folylpolyglutamate synthase/dihydrofolate synthase [Candidatus Woesearchaeota archaeon]
MTQDLDELDEQLQQLYNLKARGMKLGLENMKKLLAELGNPHQRKGITFIHATGTNGKGSVCAMLSSILKTAGYKVGMFTSPHLIRVNERIKINDQEIDDAMLCKYIQKVRPFVDAIGNTFFETINAIAFQYFADQKVDYAIIEVGLGGTYDSTNVMVPKIAVLTDIGLDHMHILGDTVEKITLEKCGIIKERIDVVTSNDHAVLEIIKKTCEQKHARLHITTASAIPTNLRGEFQKRNVAIAEKVAALLSIQKSTIKQGLLDVNWPGRMQTINYESHTFLLDCAHNQPAFAELAKELRKIPQKKIVIVGMSKDKDIKTCLGYLGDEKQIIFTKANMERGAEPEELVQYQKGVITRNLEEALEKARELDSNHEHLIVVMGSIFLVGEFLGIIKQEKSVLIGY